MIPSVRRDMLIEAARRAFANDRAAPAPAGEQQRADQPGSAAGNTHVNRFGGDFGSFQLDRLARRARYARADGQLMSQVWQHCEVSEELERAIAAAGLRLRQLRTQRQLTLDAVAGETGISKSTLSRLESGQRRASLEMLFPLARIYGVTLDELVSAPPTGDPRIHLRSVVRDGVTMLPLTRRPGGIQAYKMIYPPGVATDPDLKVHEGYEWVYVMTGRLRLVLAAHDLLLGPGEAAEFDTRTPHWFGTPPSGGAEILSLFGQQGERVHVRARSRSS